MKRQVTFAFLLALGINSYSQNIQPKSSITWGDNSINLVSNHDRVNSFQDYCIVNENEVAFIEGEESVLKQYNTLTQKLTKSFPIEGSSMFMCFNNNTFYVLGFDYLNSYDVNGNLLQSIHYVIPEDKQFSIERLVVNNGLAYIHLSDGITYQLKNDGALSSVSELYWLFNDYKASTELQSDKSLLLNVVESSKKYSQSFNLKQLGLPDMELATAKIIDVANQNAYLDIELVEEGNDIPQRYAVVINLKTLQATSTIEIPFVYSSYIQNQFKLFNGELFYSLSAQDGIYFYNLSSSNNAMITLPTTCPKHLHFNDNLLVVNDLEEIATEEENTTTNSNNHTYKISPEAEASQLTTAAVSRSNMMYMAYAFRNKTWYANSSNITNYCSTLAGLKYRTPTWVTVGSKTSIPYKWGGFTSLSNYSSYASSGKKCGNIATSYSKCGGSNHSSSSDALIIGLDCSGFVSRAWAQNTKYGTSNISAISSYVGGATSSTPFNSQLRGDAINIAGSHIRMFVQKNSNGTGKYIEEANGGGLHKVFEASYSRTSLYGYVVRKYYGASGSKISTNNSVAAAEDMNFTVYPTVTTDAFSINTDATNYSVSVLNNLGQVVFNQTNLSNTQSIDIANLNSGVYFVNITKNNQVNTIKIVKS